ncbi:MAG TPA: hypothetical protein DCX80_02610 [Chloroflexi bacterium]|nr:hypothetical protein [Chloroflexota bacterium]HBY44956.1 hypothetical protein [Chloroflexota bacterium]
MREEPPPAGWSDWDVALEDERMAERYGWTPDDIDRLGADGRRRVRYWWSVWIAWRQADEFLRQWEGQQEQNAAINAARWEATGDDAR